MGKTRDVELDLFGVCGYSIVLIAGIYLTACGF